MSSDITLESVLAGSFNNVPAGSANAGETNKAQTNENETIPKSQYDELFKKLGEQGNELGELKKFYENVSPVMPVLEKLDQNPDLVKAIMEDKLSSDLLKTISEGKASVSDAKTVAQAHEEVKKDLGAEYKDKSPQEIISAVSELLDQKLNGMKKEVSEELEKQKMLNEFKEETKAFIDSHSDFPELASDIQEYMQKTGVSDIKVCYDAVKGIKLAAKYKDEEEKRATEDAKNLAANAGGGAGMSGGREAGDGDLFDQFVSGRKNPNF